MGIVDSLKQAYEDFKEKINNKIYQNETYKKYFQNISEETKEIGDRVVDKYYEKIEEINRFFNEQLERKDKAVWYVKVYQEYDKTQKNFCRYYSFGFRLSVFLGANITIFLVSKRLSKFANPFIFSYLTHSFFVPDFSSRVNK